MRWCGDNPPRARLGLRKLAQRTVANIRFPNFALPEDARIARLSQVILEFLRQTLPGRPVLRINGEVHKAAGILPDVVELLGWPLADGELEEARDLWVGVVVREKGEGRAAVNIVIRAMRR